MLLLLYLLPGCFDQWWLGAELNRRHKDFQSSALPTELPSRLGKFIELGLTTCGKAEFNAPSIIMRKMSNSPLLFSLPLSRREFIRRSVSLAAGVSLGSECPRARAFNTCEMKF